MKQTLEHLIADFWERDLPGIVHRDADVESIPGKALAFIGMRRVGKTYLCYQKIKALLDAGTPRDQILYLNFEDDRLFGFELAHFQLLLEVFYADRPEKQNERCHFFFDEIQNVHDWERFIRRIMDTENVSIFLTGSSAKMLSVELASSLRGRSLAREVFPYSFPEYLRVHAPDLRWVRPGSHARLHLQKQTENYMTSGGFPEVQGLPAHRRREIIQSYVDAVVLRDVIERHGVSNVEALRALLHQALSSPTTRMSIHKLYKDFKSRGLRLGKDDLYAYMRHLTDAYLLFPLPLWTRSEKKRQINPKKIYLVDNGILDAYSTGQTPDRGAFLENLVYLTLRRLGLQPGYYETRQGHKVDFVWNENGQIHILQACLTLQTPATRERELRALASAASELPEPRCHIVTLTEENNFQNPSVNVLPLWKFLLHGTGK
ncbi:MAG: ATP-binding protein [Verrucomicrobia bacterium]|nr:ATP-binding protein [Verrucomicrobiota bacterium]MCH8512075.1 ATP-binding protein [Kiritimatiellia bacterium]